MTEWSIKYNDKVTEVIGDEEYAALLHQVAIERECIHPFIGDSKDYYVLHGAAKAVKNVPGLICEIGLRKGGGIKAIMDALIETKQKRTIISIDPFGSIPFEGMEGEVVPKTEYSNAMQKDTLEKMYRFVQSHSRINYIFLPLEDTEFFKRFDDGIPVYVNSTKKIINEYALVHFDGPHTLAATMVETKFFLDKTRKGSIFVYDDIQHFYDHDVVIRFLLDNGWSRTETSKSQGLLLKDKIVPDMFSEKVKFLMPKLQKDLGITKEQAAGIIGSLAAETGGFRHMQEIKPIGRGRGGWGWAQWTGPRKKTFEKKFGVGNRSDEANYGMLAHELKNDPYWSKELKRIKRAKTVAAASRAFTGSARSGTGYLRPGREHYAESEIWAKKALQIFSQQLPAKKSRNKAMVKDDHATEVMDAAWKELDDEAAATNIYEKTLQQIALVKVVDSDEVNTMKLRAVVNSAQDALASKKTDENNT